ncbi:MAG TPA: peptidoglycan DD-metalloendopeptidase family protein [Polyangiaceae bacterium]|jgi:murein DD-endopeptidase MepM/ murein hydrolase activator NlpD
MKVRVVSFLGSLLVAASASAFAPTDEPEIAPKATQTQNPAQRDLGGNAERHLNELSRQTQADKAELERVSKDADEAHARIITRGRVYVRLAKAGLLPVGGGFDSFVEHAVRLERLRSAIGRDEALERELSKRRITLARELTELEARRSSLETEVQAMATAQSALLSEQDRADAFARAFSSSVGSAHTAVYGAGVGPSDSAASDGFAALKGRLPFPLTGRSEIRSARRPGSEGPGLEMFAPRGSVVRAVHAGRVAFADSYAAYGRTVILDHGGGYYTVSANLGTIEVKVGDDVQFGVRIGTVGDSDGAARLYFEIRVGTDTVAPSDWFGI